MIQISGLLDMVVALLSVCLLLCAAGQLLFGVFMLPGAVRLMRQAWRERLPFMAAVRPVLGFSLAAILAVSALAHYQTAWGVCSLILSVICTLTALFAEEWIHRSLVPFAGDWLGVGCRMRDMRACFRAQGVSLDGLLSGGGSRGDIQRAIQWSGSRRGTVAFAQRVAVQELDAADEHGNVVFELEFDARPVSYRLSMN